MTEDAEGNHVEAIEEDLARAFVCVAQEAGEEGEQDGRFILYALEFQFRKGDVLPVVVMLIVCF
jgi:hypothetical protein